MIHLVLAWAAAMAPCVLCLWVAAHHWRGPWAAPGAFLGACLLGAWAAWAALLPLGRPAPGRVVAAATWADARVLAWAADPGAALHLFLRLPSGGPFLLTLPWEAPGAAQVVDALAARGYDPDAGAPEGALFLAPSEDGEPALWDAPLTLPPLDKETP